MSYDTYDPTGIDEKLMTFQKSGTITEGTHEGKSCYLAGNMQVAVGVADQPFFGIIKKISGDDITVQFDGVFKAPYSGTAPTVGIQKLECGANGTVAVDATNGHECEVLKVDTTNALVWFRKR